MITIKNNKTKINKKTNILLQITKNAINYIKQKLSNTLKNKTQK